LGSFHFLKKIVDLVLVRVMKKPVLQLSLQNELLENQFSKHLEFEPKTPGRETHFLTRRHKLSYIIM